MARHGSAYLGVARPGSRPEAGPGTALDGRRERVVRDPVRGLLWEEDRDQRVRRYVRGDIFGWD
jgi:hypothetical protein